MLGAIVIGVLVLVFVTMIGLLRHFDLRDGSGHSIHVGHGCALPPNHRQTIAERD